MEIRNFLVHIGDTCYKVSGEDLPRVMVDLYNEGTEFTVSPCIPLSEEEKGN